MDSVTNAALDSRNNVLHDLARRLKLHHVTSARSNEKHSIVTILMFSSAFFLDGPLIISYPNDSVNGSILHAIQSNIDEKLFVSRLQRAISTVAVELPTSRTYSANIGWIKVLCADTDRLLQNNLDYSLFIAMVDLNLPELTVEVGLYPACQASSNIFYELVEEIFLDPKVARAIYDSRNGSIKHASNDDDNDLQQVGFDMLSSLRSNLSADDSQEWSLLGVFAKCGSNIITVAMDPRTGKPVLGPSSLVRNSLSLYYSMPKSDDESKST